MAKSQTLQRVFFFSTTPNGHASTWNAGPARGRCAPRLRDSTCPGVYTGATSDLCNLSRTPPPRRWLLRAIRRQQLSSSSPTVRQPSSRGGRAGRGYPQSARQPGHNEPTAGLGANADANGFLQFRSTVRVPTVLIRTGISNRRASRLLPFWGEEKAPDEGNGPSRGNKGSGVEQWEW